MTRSTHLLGGGWDPAHTVAMYAPFLDAAGPDPSIAVLVIDEGDGPEQVERWAEVLRRTAPCTPRPVLVALGSTLDPAQLDGADGLLVCGGLTPAYAETLAPVADPLRHWLTNRPYAGFSAGAVVAAEQALVGGWLQDGRPVCPEDTAEDLEEITVVAGLGLLGLTVDVHCAQWGTLPRLLAAVASGHLKQGLALDEDTALHVTGNRAVVAGRGAVRVVTRTGAGVQVTTHLPSTEFDLANS